MTLSISAIKRTGMDAAKTGFVYLLVSLFCVVFGAVYEHFSHEVYSAYMIYAFVFPLFGGALPFLSLLLLGKPMPNKLVQGLYHCGVMTLTVGSIVEGVLEIYGTTNKLTGVYWTAGAVFCGVAVVAIFISSKTKQ